MNDNEEQLEFINVGSTDLGGNAGNPMGSGPVYGAETGGQPAGVGGFIRQSRHPVAVGFHFLFKLLAVLVYMFSGFFSSNFVFIFVICILLLACDFWTVKNVTGRLLVGLRWWSKVTDDGKTEWKFESLEDMGEVHASDSRLFWLGLYVTPLVWGALFIIGLLKFNIQWLIIVVVALSLSGANIVGYTKCRKDAKQKLASFVEGGMARGMSSMMANEGLRNSFLSFFTGGSGSTGNQAPNQQQAYV
mmetsp:Transcript_40/g.44  ORF Transcript_40/g.44 Transcript_40/m.44 type:complete len:246 (+) Transcript_40:163-900(+)|eukprot:CAMPEP_0117756884 /NCGR_PEP_ID=MMETSP0947-20121206/14372_1 /TAXON_ID=44440 /ORGANISM="Chattonella subsalsa, Strain CCMP2191" /LENGTH=245 /DNA_ID=CAMNT_0005576613 /DNA_START=173 /DNA_END=910 /DNA_ORIENTATION=-